jgi:hypothetical protein
LLSGRLLGLLIESLSDECDERASGEAARAFFALEAWHGAKRPTYRRTA